MALGLTALLAACGGGGGGGSTPPVQSRALVWGTSTWGSNNWSAPSPLQLEPDRSSVPSDLTNQPTTTLTSLETSR